MTTKPYYTDDSTTVYLGAAEDVLPDLEAVDHFIADPPYSEHVHGAVRSAKMMANDRGGKYGSDTRRQVDLGFDHLTPELRTFLSEQAARLTRRWVLIFSDVESDYLWRDDLIAAGLDYVRTGAWVKLNSTPQFSGDRPATAFEAITIAHPKGRKRWNGGGQHALWSVPIVLNRSGKEPRWHETQKPLPLMSALVEQFTDPGDVILDPTAGSGTTGVAAKRLGRRSVLIERREKNCESIVKRIQAEQPLDLIPQTATASFDFGGAA